MIPSEEEEEKSQSTTFSIGRLLPWMLTEAVFDVALAWNVKFIA